MGKKEANGGNKGGAELVIRRNEGCHVEASNGRVTDHSSLKSRERRRRRRRRRQGRGGQADA